MSTQIGEDGAQVVHPKIRFKRVTVLILDENEQVLEIINNTLEGCNISQSMATYVPEVIAHMLGINIREFDFRRMLTIRKSYGFNLQLEYKRSLEVA